jgi:predicted phosphoribosyltransferase
VYRNRKEAGKQLAKKLKKLQDEGKITVPVVVALPRGGVPVGAEIAKELNAPFDIFL